MRKLKIEYEKLASEKKREVSDLSRENGFVWSQLKCIEPQVILNHKSSSRLRSPSLYRPSFSVPTKARNTCKAKPWKNLGLVINSRRYFKSCIRWVPLEFDYTGSALPEKTKENDFLGPV